MLMGYEDQHKMCAYQVTFHSQGVDTLRGLLHKEKKDEEGKKSNKAPTPSSSPQVSAIEDKDTAHDDYGLLAIAFEDLDVDKVLPRSARFRALCEDFVKRGQYRPDAVSVTPASATLFIFHCLMKSVHPNATPSMLDKRSLELQKLLELHKKYLQLEEEQAQEEDNLKM